MRRLRGGAAFGAALGAAVGMGLILASAQAQAARLVNVRIGVDGDRTRVVFELDAPAGHQLGPVQAATGGGELVVKIDAGSDERIVPAKSELVRSVRVQPAGGGAEARIALRTQHVRVSELTLGGPPRLVFDLRPAEGGVAAAPPARGLAPAAGPRVAVATPPPAARASSRARPAAADRPSDFERNVERQLNERVGLPAPPPPPRPAEAPAQGETAPAEAGASEPAVTPEGAAPSGEAGPAAPAEAAPGETPPAARAPAPPEEAKPAPAAEAPPAKPPLQRPALGPTSWLDLQIVLLAVAALLLLFLVWRRLGRRVAAAAREPIVPLRFTEVLPEPEEEEEAPRLPLFEAAAPSEPAELAEPVEPEAAAIAVEPSLPASLGERETAPLLSGDLDAVVVDERAAAAEWVDLPGHAAAPARATEPEGALARLVRELERRIAHVETRLEEAADARERLERHMAAQTEELRVQRAAIARTQRVLRSLARPEDLATEPVPRDPGRGSSS